MKKRILICSIVLILYIVLQPTIFATTTPSITITGSDKITVGETGILTLSVISEDKEVGVISGIISKDVNISDLIVNSKNNWNITYNSETGEFNIYKAEGSKNEEFMTVEYTIKEDSTEEAKISLSDIKVTTIDYNDIDIQDVEHKIAIEEPQESEEPHPNPGEEKFPVEEDEKVTEEEENNNSGIENEPKDDNVTNQISNDNAQKEDTTTSKELIPQAGEEITILLVGIISIIVSIIIFVKYKVK